MNEGHALEMGHCHATHSAARLQMSLSHALIWDETSE